MDRSLFEVSAEVIPVLFFALLFQLDGFRRTEDEVSPRVEWFLLATIVLAAVGEFVSLSVLGDSESKPTIYEKIVVMTAITFLFLPAIFRAGAPRIEAIGKAYPWSNPLGTLAILVIGVGFVVMGVAQVPVAPVMAVGAVLFLIVVLVTIGFAEHGPVYRRWGVGAWRWLRRKPPESPEDGDQG